jgi:hypothetical protein
LILVDNVVLCVSHIIAVEILESEKLCLNNGGVTRAALSNLSTEPTF